MDFPYWAYRWAVASLSLCFSIYAFSSGNLAFLTEPAFVSNSVSLILASVFLTVAVGLLGDTFWAAMDHRKEVGPGQSMDPGFRRHLSSVLFRQLAVILIILFSLKSLSVWLTEKILQYIELVRNDPTTPIVTIGQRSMLGWTGPMAVGIAMILNIMLWRTGPIERILFSLRLNGGIGFMRGMARIAILRAFSPAKDFFEHVPGFRSLGALSVAAFLWADAPSKIAGIVSVSGMSLITLVYTITSVLPPTWLFLSASDFQSFQVFRILRITWWPRNGMTLLNRSGYSHFAAYTAERTALERSGAFGSTFAGFYTTPTRPRLWSIRARDRAWEPVLLTLLRSVPLIIIDIRGGSDLVVRELRTILHSGWTEKTIIIGKTANDITELHEILRNEGGQLLASRIVTEEMLSKAVWLERRLTIHKIEVSI